MTNLSNVLTPERRAKDQAACTVVMGACGVLLLLTAFIAVCWEYRWFGATVATLLLCAACGLVGFEVGRRFERRAE